MLSQLAFHLGTLSLRHKLLEFERGGTRFPLVCVEIFAKLLELRGGRVQLRGERLGLGVNAIVELDGKLHVGEIHAESVEKKPLIESGFLEKGGRRKKYRNCRRI